VTIFVHPQHRRQGIGRALLARAADFARQRERTLLITLAYSRIPAGEQFLCRVGARPGLETCTNQLKITDVPTGWVEMWVEAGERLADRFEIGLWDGPLPEEHLAAEGKTAVRPR
jgi:GNAT superfamily N-acetyltransferase